MHEARSCGYDRRDRCAVRRNVAPFLFPITRPGARSLLWPSRLPLPDRALSSADARRHCCHDGRLPLMRALPTMGYDARRHKVPHPAGVPPVCGHGPGWAIKAVVLDDRPAASPLPRDTCADCDSSRLQGNTRPLRGVPASDAQLSSADGPRVGSAARASPTAASAGSGPCRVRCWTV